MFIVTGFWSNFTADIEELNCGLRVLLEAVDRKRPSVGQINDGTGERASAMFVLHILQINE